MKLCTTLIFTKVLDRANFADYPESGIFYCACAKCMTSIQITEEDDQIVGESFVKNFCKNSCSAQFKLFPTGVKLFILYTCTCMYMLYLDALQTRQKFRTF